MSESEQKYFSFYSQSSSKNTRRYTLEDMKKIAKSRGGLCISEKYVNCKTKLKWECAKGHQWCSTPDSVINGCNWCPHCAGNAKLSMEQMHLLAQERGGKCLSEEYVNNQTELLWECSKGHRWEARPGNIQQEKWCPHCYGNISYTLQDMQQIAELFGGKCLSKEYSGVNNNLKWECANGHQWLTRPSNILYQNSWCPDCSKGIGESLTRKIFEELFGCAFPSTFPQWLKNSEDNTLELDGYNETLKLAFEYHGSQHFEYNPYFHSTEDRFKKRKRDDELKRKECQKRDIVLIEIPHTVKHEKLEDFIVKACREKGFFIEKKNFEIEQLLGEAFRNSELQEMRELAKSKGGECLSQAYINAKTKMRWKCKEGHVWEADPDKVKNGGNWCPDCAGVAKGSIQEMNQLAKERNGKCLSKKYINANTKLNWECDQGHSFWTTPHNVKSNGRWCPTCAGNKKLTIEEMRELAESKGGECLSEKYVNNSTKLKWRCQDGHIWEAVPASVRNGTWCRECGGTKKLTIEEMRELAESRGGKCLSEKYVNNRTKLTWKCGEGHTWQATPSSIKRGSWCPDCAGNVKLTIEEMREFAESKGGECLSDSYINNITKLKWQCENEHIWFAIPSQVLRGSWCPECAGTKKLTIEDMRELAKSKGGECLSEKYENALEKLLWQCNKGHSWETTASKVRSGTWCPKCAGNKKLTISEMKELAKTKGGECLSKEYINSNTKLKWKCKKGHVWTAIPNNVKRGSWCPKCYRSKSKSKK